VREVKQWQFLEWSESKVPLNGKNILKLFELIDNYAGLQAKMGQEESIYGNAKAVVDHNLLHNAKPLIIHCSSGLGRTGTISSILVGLKRLQEEDKVDIFTVCGLIVSTTCLMGLGCEAHSHAAPGYGPDHGESIGMSHPCAHLCAGPVRVYLPHAARLAGHAVVPQR
jgi:hypothetical protein